MAVHRQTVVFLLLFILIGLPRAGAAKAAKTPATCAPRRVLLTHGYGGPDDLAVQGSRILFTDEPQGIVGSLSVGRVRVLVRGMAGPEGIVARAKNRALVAEQDLNRIDEVNLGTGSRRVLFTVRNNTGRLGVDAFSPAPNGKLYVPDSPYGRLLLMDLKGRFRVLVAGLGRPVDAARYAGGVSIADETANAVWLLKSGRLTRLTTLSTPDDVVSLDGKLLAVTLGDGALWEAYPHRRMLVGGFGEPQGLAVLNRDAVAVADSKANSIYRISGLQACL